MWVSTTRLAKIEGVTSQTIRRKIQAGLYQKVRQTQGGHYRIFIQQQRKIGYARVSSAKQRSSLNAQQDILRNRHPDAELVSDIASAFNFKRKGLQAILESAMLGYPTHVVVTTKDRLARSGFELIRWLIELSGGQIDVLEDPDSASEAFDTKELIGFVTSFCNSHYGKRSAKRRKSSGLEKNSVLSEK